MGMYDGLNPEQLKAVQHFEGPLLILAGAGSGKTRVLTHRVAWLIEEKGVSPWNILAITFTNKAAGEMRERVNGILNRLMGEEDSALAGSVWVSTFHSLCVRILRRYIDRIGYGANFTIYDADDQKTVVREICKRLNIDTKLYKERIFMSMISAAKDECISPEAFWASVQGTQDVKRKLAAQIYVEYQKLLHASNALDFDDLISKTVELFEACPEVLEAYRERFRFIMVDEYQDTNTSQFRLVSLLAKKYRNLCVVGDDDQSIYRFRGANIGNILNFEEVFPGAAVIRLEQNYRSTQNILNAANAVIAHNTGRKEKTLWTENAPGSLLHFRQFPNGFEEADFVVNRIVIGQGAGRKLSDFAILYRTNAQSRMFEEKLLLANVPYRIVGGVNFYSRKEIKDVLAYLKLITNTGDDLSVRRIINVPRRGIGATSIGHVQNYALKEEISFYQALCHVEEIPEVNRSMKKLQDFARLIQTFRAKMEYLKVKDLIEDVLETTGYRLELTLEGGEEAKERLANLDEFLNKAALYDETAEKPTLYGFLEEVALVSDIDSVQGEADQVLLMTLHSAKGLEFPTVFLAGMEDGTFPSYLCISSEDPMDLEEERRLCYVGITRARKELYLTASKTRMVRGELHYSRVSRFIEDIPEELMEAKTNKETKKEKPQQTPMGVAPQKRTFSQLGKQAAREAFQAKAFAQPAQAAVKKADGLDYAVGDRVRHIKFGEGEVTAIAEGGRDYEVSVNFDRVGAKKMFASFAKLKKVE